VLDRSRPNRTFRRISGAALRSLLPGTESAAPDGGGSEGAENSDGEA
jgi:proteasome alpha subunit